MWQYFGYSNSHKNVDVSGHRFPLRPLLFLKGRHLECSGEVVLGRIYRRLWADISVSTTPLPDTFSCLRNMKSGKSDTLASHFHYVRKTCEERQLRFFSVYYQSCYFCHMNINHKSSPIVITFNSFGLTLKFHFHCQDLAMGCRTNNKFYLQHRLRMFNIKKHIPLTQRQYPSYSYFPPLCDFCLDEEK